MSDKIVRFDPQQAKRKERSASGHPVYIFECEDCGSDLRVRHLKRKSKKCRKCCQRKKPFNKSYQNLRSAAARKNLEFNINYNQFLKFTKQDKCHYCLSLIVWQPFDYSKYHLDRKDNDLGYFIDNCVVCCTRCNYAKSNRYTYHEWFGMTQYFRKKAGVE